MKISEVRKLPIWKRFYYWIEERESIRLKKEVGKPQPWTDDEILSTYRFCNVRRMDDKVSQWLLKNWYEPYFNHKQVITASVIARMFNNPEALSKITQEVFVVKGIPKFGKIKSILKSLRASGETVFNGAYIVSTSGHKADKVDFVIDRYVKPLKVDISELSMKDTWKSFIGNYGFSGFMSGQVTADLRHAVNNSWSDAAYWAPAGPGSTRGICRLYQEKFHKLKDEEFEGRLETLIDDVRIHLPTSITERLEAIDYQNCLCEFDKYERAIHGEGKPKQLYRKS